MRKGFSIVELFVVMSILGILFAICAGVAGTGCVTTSERQASAEENARNFAKAMGWEIGGVVCSGADTPNSKGAGDGYVSCTLSIPPKEEGGELRTKAILCGYKLMFAPMGQNTSCKEATPLTVQSQ